MEGNIPRHELLNETNKLDVPINWSEHVRSKCRWCLLQFDSSMACPRTRKLCDYKDAIKSVCALVSVKRDIFTQASCIAVQTVCDTLYGQKYHVLLDHAVENEPSLQKFKTKIFKTRKIWRETECSHFCLKLSRLWKRCEICSKLTIKTPERCPCRRSLSLLLTLNLFHLFLVFLLLTLNR